MVIKIGVPKIYKMISTQKSEIRTNAPTNTRNAYFEQFNKFQTLFFTDPNLWNKFTRFELKRFGYVLLNNIAKGFPNLIDIIINLKGIGWDGVNSIQILRALQHQLMNSSNSSRVPIFVYFKNMKPEVDKTVKARVSKRDKNLLDFDMEIQRELCSILMYDSKTYEELKYSDKIQKLGRELLSEMLAGKTTRKN